MNLQAAHCEIGSWIHLLLQMKSWLFITFLILLASLWGEFLETNYPPWDGQNLLLLQSPAPSSTRHFQSPLDAVNLHCTCPLWYRHTIIHSVLPISHTPKSDQRIILLKQTGIISETFLAKDKCIRKSI